MMNFFRQLFVWWRGQTLGTRMMTFFRGRRVGSDLVGNHYYRHRASATKRWVIYHGLVDASKVPPEWHAWLHNMVPNPPRKDSTNDDLPWYQPHRANMTGTESAQIRTPAITGDEQATPIEYQPWVPPDSKT